MKRLYLLTVILVFVWAFVATPVLAGPQLGVFLQELDDDLREEFNFTGKGVLVTDIVDDSGADEAGIKSGDIIVQFKNDDITTIQGLRLAIDKEEFGVPVPVRIFRDGDYQTLEVTMKEKEEINWTSKFDNLDKFMFFEGNGGPWVGIEMQELNTQLAGYFKVSHGVLISEVKEGSPAEKSGLKAGDVLTYFGDEKVDETKDVFDELDDLTEGDQVDLTVVRDGKEKKFKVELGAHKNFGAKTFHFSFDDDVIHHIPDISDDEIEIFVTPDKIKKDVHIIRKEKEEVKKEMEELRKEMQLMKEELKKMKEESK